MDLPFIPAMAFCASSGVLIVTKPNPRARPVARSIIKFASVTVPKAANAASRSFSVVLKERFPTNNLLLMQVHHPDQLLFPRLFPAIGIKIITELSSPED